MKYDTHYSERIRVVTTDGRGKTYGVTLPEEVAGVGIEKRDHLDAHLAVEKTPDEEVMYIVAERLSEEADRKGRKVQGGTENHPKLFFTLPKDWTRGESESAEFPVEAGEKMRVVLVDDDALLVVREEEFFNHFERSDYVTMQVPVEQLEALDELIEKGEIDSYSDAVKSSLDELFQDDTSN